MKDLELRLTDLLARKADEVDVRPVDGFAETPYMTALASTDLDSVTETRDLATIDLEPTNAKPAPSRNRRRVAQGVLAAAAVVAIAVVATHDGDGPTDEPSPIATVPPTTPPRPLPNPESHLAPGTYFVDEVSGTPTPRIFFTIGAGWDYVGDGWIIGGPGKHGAGDGAGSINFDRPGAVFLDACHWSDGYHPGPETTLDGLVAALTEQEGWASVTVSDIVVDGYVGKAFQRTTPAISDCDILSAYGPRIRPPAYSGNSPAFRGWLNADGTAFGSGFGPGEVETVWVLDLGGTIVAIRATLYPSSSTWDVALEGPSAEARAEFAAVLDSIRIDRA